MPYNERTPGGSPAPAHTYPISRAFALTVLGALLVLLLLRHLFGSISVQVGAR
jgi:hypothetical protein